MSGSDFGSLAVRTPRVRGPWTADHLNRLLMGNAAGLLLLGTCWWQVSGTGSVRTQVTWLVAGIAGLGAAGVSNASWLLRGLQSISAGRDVVLPRMLQRRARTLTGTARADRATVVTVEGTLRFHHPACPLVAGKPVAEIDRPPDRSSLIACEVCEPS